MALLVFIQGLLLLRRGQLDGLAGQLETFLDGVAGVIDGFLECLHLDIGDLLGGLLVQVLLPGKVLFFGDELVGVGLFQGGHLRVEGGLHGCNPLSLAVLLGGHRLIEEMDDMLDGVVILHLLEGVLDIAVQLLQPGLRRILHLLPVALQRRLEFPVPLQHRILQALPGSDVHVREPSPEVRRGLAVRLVDGNLRGDGRSLQGEGAGLVLLFQDLAVGETLFQQQQLFLVPVLLRLDGATVGSVLAAAATTCALLQLGSEPDILSVHRGRVGGRLGAERSGDGLREGLRGGVVPQIVLLIRVEEGLHFSGRLGDLLPNFLLLVVDMLVGVLGEEGAGGDDTVQVLLLGDKAFILFRLFDKSRLLRFEVVRDEGFRRLLVQAGLNLEVLVCRVLVLFGNHQAVVGEFELQRLHLFQRVLPVLDRQRRVAEYRLQLLHALGGVGLLDIGGVLHLEELVAQVGRFAGQLSDLLERQFHLARGGCDPSDEVVPDRLGGGHLAAPCVGETLRLRREVVQTLLYKRACGVDGLQPHGREVEGRNDFLQDPAGGLRRSAELGHPCPGGLQLLAQVVPFLRVRLRLVELAAKGLYPAGQLLDGHVVQGELRAQLGQGGRVPLDGFVLPLDGGGELLVAGGIGLALLGQVRELLPHLLDGVPAVYDGGLQVVDLLAGLVTVDDQLEG